MEEEYKLTHTGPQVDDAVGRALPGGAIDAALAGKVNKAGDTMTGSLTISKSDYPELNIKNTGSGSATKIRNSAHRTQIMSQEDESNYRVLTLYDKSVTTDARSILQIQQIEDGSQTASYNVYHTGNKPSLGDIGAAASGHKHDAGDITSGTFESARLPTVPVSKGGTGKTTLTSGSYLVGDGTSAVALKTPLEVLSNIGAAASSHNHAASDITSGTLSSSRLPTVPVSKGGTGKTSLTSGSYLVGNGTSAVAFKTPAEVLSNIGAAASTHTHAITNITGMIASRVVVSGSNGAGTIMGAPSSNGCFLRQNDSGAPYWDTEDTVASVMKVKFTSGLTEYALDQASSVTSGHLYYLKMENGVSAIRGVVGGSFTSGTVIGTLPSGYRPVSAYTGIVFATASSGTSLCTYEIATTGTITIKNLPSTYQYITLSSGVFKSN